jgi:hypothetical protein
VQKLLRAKTFGSLPKPENFWHGFWQYRLVDFQWFTTEMVCCQKIETLQVAGKEI